MFHLLKSTTILISGPTNSSKTFFVSRFIKNLDYLMSPPPERIVWWYSIWQKAYDQVEADFIQSIPDFEYFDRKPAILIIDDLMGEKTEAMTKFFTRGSHHLNLMIFYLVQNLFFRGIRTIALNSQIVILFKNPHNSGQLSFFLGSLSLNTPKKSKNFFLTRPNILTDIFYSISALKPWISFESALVCSQKINSLYMY